MSGVAGEGGYDVGMDNQPFTILSYANGPGYFNYGAEGEGNWTQINRQDVFCARTPPPSHTHIFASSLKLREMR